ncbi:MAG TPA: glycosyltransferase [Micromonosporaceae bacterium]
MGDPQITVVIPVYNAADYLDECLRSIVGQTIGFDHLEVVAVDDGSTDGSSDKLDGWAASHPNISVVHQPNSGAPGAPRNRAVALARGEYVFFADADDYLGVEALERMLAVASRNESDIVLGRIRGVNRTAATRPFRRSVERGDVVSTDAVWSLTAHKLVRRSLIVDNGLRFAEGVRLAEEQPLIVPAYFLARAISVVADYDCYHLVLREHAAHLTQQPADPATFFPVVRFAVETVVANTTPGPARDGMLRRWAQVEIAGKFGRWFAGLPAEVREEYVKRSAEILDDLIPPEVFDPLAPLERIRGALIRRRRTTELVELSEYERSGTRPRAVVDGDRAYAAYPFFRDPGRGVPDACYDITGVLTLDHCRVRVTCRNGLLRIIWDATLPALRAPDVSWSLVLRRDDGRELVVPARRTDTGAAVEVRLAAADDGRPLADGRWTAVTDVRAGGRHRRLAIGENQTLDDSSDLRPTRAGRAPVRPGPDDVSRLVLAVGQEAGAAGRRVVGGVRRRSLRLIGRASGIARDAVRHIRPRHAG